MRDLPNPESLARRSGQQANDSALLRASTELFVQDSEHDRDEIRRFEELAEYLVPRVNRAARVFAADRLAERIDAPPSVMRMLARDTLEVAQFVLSRSPVFEPLDLLSIIAATGPEHHRLIAARPALDEDVERALRLTGDPVVMQNLAGSPPIDDVSIDVGSATTDVKDATTRDIYTPDTPLEIADRFDPWRFLAHDRGTRLRLMADLSERILEDDSTRSSKRADQAFRATLGAAKLTAYARSGDRQAIVETIGDGLGIGTELVAACLDDPTGEPLAILLKALSLDRIQAQQIMLLMSPAGRHPGAFLALSDLYSGMEPVVAETLVSTWATRPATKPARHQPAFADTIERVKADPGITRVEPSPAQRKVDGRG